MIATMERTIGFRDFMKYSLESGFFEARSRALPTRRQRVIEHALHGSESLHEFELLAFWPLAVDQSPAVGLPFGDAIAVRGDRRREALAFRVDGDDAIRPDLRHA